MLPVLIALMMAIFAGLAVSRWVEKRERARAEEWIASFHGEKLPSAETLRGRSATFLLTVMPYYLEEGRKHRAKLEAQNPPAPVRSSRFDPVLDGGECPDCALIKPRRCPVCSLQATINEQAVTVTTLKRKLAAKATQGVAGPPPPRCQLCKDLGFFPELNAFGGGICPACGKKRNRR